MPIIVPDGSAVFLDANIFVYHFSGPTPYTAPCAQLLQRIENGALSGFTSTLVVAETLHRLMIIEGGGVGQAFTRDWGRKLMQPS